MSAGPLGLAAAAAGIIGAPPLFPLTLSLYAVSFTLYCVALGMFQQTPSPGAARYARWVLVAACLSQLLDIGWSCAHGRNPTSGTREAVFFASFMISTAYLGLTLRQSIPVVATLLLPVSMALGSVARLSPGEIPQAVTALRTFHILSASLGVAVFAVAAGISFIYVLTERQLKRHNLGQIARRGASLQTLDNMGRRAILLGFPIFTLAVVSGAVFFDRLSGGLEHPLLALRHPQYVMSMVTWLNFAVLVIARVVGGMRGRRAAYLTLCGFFMALSVLLLYVLRGLLYGGTPS